jgi:hypothetical protein
MSGLSIFGFSTVEAFDPEVTHAMGLAFDEACKALRLSDMSSQTARLVAKKIIELAQQGEHDPICMRTAVLAGFRSGPRPPDPLDH